MQTIYKINKIANKHFIITSNNVYGNAFSLVFESENEATEFCKQNNLPMVSFKKTLAVKIVGYTNLSLLGKRNTLKVYKTKASCKVAALKIVAKAKIKAAKQFVDDFANVLKGEALKAKVWTAKRVLRLKGWTWSNYIAVCNAFRLLRKFNNSVSFDLRVKL